MPDSGHPSLMFHRLPKARGGDVLSAGDRRILRNLAVRLSRDVAGGRPFTCLLAGDEDLRRLNREFLGHDEPTDVLSFPSAAQEGPLGEVAISVERAVAQASEQGHALLDEIGVLMLHGVLHLMGMDHERDDGQMRRVESEWRQALGLPGGLIERSGPEREA